MSKKKPTKAQIEATEKAALRKRLKDIAAGACAPYSPPDFDNPDDRAGMATGMGVEIFQRWIIGIRNGLLDGRQSDERVSLRTLHHFDMLDDAVEFLWEHGVRA